MLGQCRELKARVVSFAINAGSNKSNYHAKDLANAVSALISNTKTSINKDALPDKRSYSVDFSLYEALAPEFQPIVSLNDHHPPS